MNATTKHREALAQDVKKFFRNLGTCSRTFFHLLNRHFGTKVEDEQRASDLLAGGIMKKGFQCGMLSGASLAVGTEAYKVCTHKSQAIAVLIEATRMLASQTDVIQQHYFKINSDI
ncbi:MAG: hypothetical protein GY908_11315 [Flavobacteriales bacterium]|nr:hypothetical protein [Flavobacteriales bacterium]